MAPRLPRLWLFTDDRRLPDPRAAVAALPRARAGVVLRHDSDPARAALGRDLARICRARRLVLVVAGDLRLAASLRAGVHLRGGRWPGLLRPRGVVTSSAHTVADMRRAAGAGADLVFLSPAFPTSSHPGAPGLGPLRWGAMVRRLPSGITSMRLAALGGVDSESVRRLPFGRCQAVGAISALSA
jgi:thiamine-phosphate pyrophosphorylase